MITPYSKWLKGDYCAAEEVQKCIADTCNQCGIGHIYEHIEWCFSSRFKTTLGQAEAWLDKEDGRKRWSIKLASRLWMEMSPAERKNTIVHEVCHLAAMHLYTELDDDHGPEWQALMRKCNEDPFMVSYVD